MVDVKFRYWRVWVEDEGTADCPHVRVRVARDKDRGCEHLAMSDENRVEWFPHRQGDPIGSVHLGEFVAWLETTGGVR